MITKTVGAALLLGSLAGSLALGVGTANADTGLPDPNPNPFTGLTCDCPDSGAPGTASQLDQGIRVGVAAAPHQSVNE